jgi:hypothetical protein
MVVTKCQQPIQELNNGLRLEWRVRARAASERDTLALVVNSSRTGTSPLPVASHRRLRAAVAAAALVIVLAIGVGQVALLSYTPVGDAAGAGMERAFMALLAWCGAPFEGGLIGLALGLLLPRRATRAVAILGVLGALTGWVGSSIAVGTLGFWAQHDWLDAPYVQVVVVTGWVAGFVGVGLALGAERGWRAALASTLVLPLGAMVPLVWFLTSS